MLTMDVWPYGEHSTVCTKVQVREDRVSKFGLAIWRTKYCMYKSTS